MWTGRSLYFLLLAGIACFVIAHGDAVDLRLRQLDQVVVGAATAEALATNTRVPRFLSPEALDSFLWIDHARALANSGDWRLRWTWFDNAPEGRPVRWSSGFALWLVGLGRVWAGVHDTGIEDGIERAGVWACPILFLGCVALLSAVVMRYGGVLAAGAIAVALLASGDVYGGFIPGEPDHHGLAAVCAVGTLLGLAMAVSDPRAARLGVVVSALAGAIGLWISAVTQSFAFVFLGIGISVVLGWLYRRRLQSTAGPRQVREESARQARKASSHRDRFDGDMNPGLLDSSMWRMWGRVGALVSIAFYIFEYVPDAVSWHVEVNHPLYSLAWLAGAEMLAMWSERVHPGRTGPTQNAALRTVKLVLCALLVLGPALAVLVLGERAHALRDPFLAALHSQISELQPITDLLRVGDASLLQALGVLPLVAIAAAFALRWNISMRQRATLMLCLVPLAVATVLRVYQVRWGVIWGGFAVALAAVALPVLTRALRERWGARPCTIVLATALLVAMIGPSSILRGAIQHAEMGEELTLPELRALILRDVALQIRTGAESLAATEASRSEASSLSAGSRHEGDRRAVALCVLAGPASSVLLSYFGGIPSIGTLYWENTEGLRAAAELATARTNEEALRLATERKLTHVVLTEWEDFATHYDAVLQAPSSARPSGELFAHRMAESASRAEWLRETPYPELPQASSLGLRTRIFEVSSPNLLD